MISLKPLSDILNNPERIGLVERWIIERSHSGMSYSQTNEGWELREYLIPMEVWVSKRKEERLGDCPIRAIIHSGSDAGMIS